MAAEPYVESEDDEFNYTLHWREAIEATEPGGQSLTEDSQESIRVGYIPANMKRSAARFFKGFAYTDELTQRLYREQPHPDPEFPSLRAYSVKFQAIAPKSETDNTDNAPFKLSPFGGVPAAVGEDEKLKLPTEATEFEFGLFEDKPLFTGNYESCLCTVRYKSWGRVRFLKDEEAVDGDGEPAEYLRNVDFTTEAISEALTQEGTGSGLTWVDGPNGPTPRATPSDPDGNAGNEPAGWPIPAPTVELLTKTKLVMRWLAVPHEYVSRYAFILKPEKFLRCQNTVNSKYLFGVFPPGTARMLPAKFDPVQYAVVPADPRFPLGGYNVTVEWEIFDPPLGYQDDSPLAYRGWNNFIYRGKGDGSGGIALGKWFHATRDGEAEGPPYVPYEDHYIIFDHVLKPVPDDGSSEEVELGTDPADPDQFGGGDF